MKKVWPTDRQTDRQTDRPTDRVSYRAAQSQLKRRASLLALSWSSSSDPVVWSRKKLSHCCERIWCSERSCVAISNVKRDFPAVSGPLTKGPSTRIAYCTLPAERAAWHHLASSLRRTMRFDRQVLKDHLWTKQSARIKRGIFILFYLSHCPFL